MRRTKYQGMIPALIVGGTIGAITPSLVSGFDGWMRGLMGGLIGGSSTCAFQLLYAAAFLSRYTPQRLLLVCLALLSVFVVLVAFDSHVRLPLIAASLALAAFALHLRYAYGIEQIFPEIVDSVPGSVEQG